MNTRYFDSVDCFTPPSNSFRICSCTSQPEQDLRSGLCDPASLHVAEPLHSHDPPVHKHVVQRWYSRQQLPWVSPKAYSFEQREAVIKHLASKWPAEITDAVDSFDASGVHSKGPVVFCDTSQSCREYY
mgnify:CR=1 FL=1